MQYASKAVDYVLWIHRMNPFDKELTKGIFGRVEPLSVIFKANKTTS